MEGEGDRVVQGQMMIECGRPECGRQFAAPTMRTHVFQALYMKYGWRWRGSVNGRVYFCPQHSELVLDGRGSKVEKVNERKVEGT
jgi:hypothetical protein